MAITAGGTTTAYVCNAPQPAPLVDAAAIARINEWAGRPGGAWTLCYKATRDNVGFGFPASNAVAFHSRCDGLGPSFFVARTSQGHLFGGYRATPWDGQSCAYRSDPAAFLFSLSRDTRYDLTSPTAASGAVYDCGTLGPSFGVGRDFSTDLRATASVSLGYTYACPEGTSGPQCAEEFAGAMSPVLTDLEVYVAQ